MAGLSVMAELPMAGIFLPLMEMVALPPLMEAELGLKPKLTISCVLVNIN